MLTGPRRVFISYSHDSVEHAERVLALADRLRSDGVDCDLDQYVTAPPEGWPQWMQSQIERADFVLVVASETYLRRASGNEIRGVGHGARFESVLIEQELYEAGMHNEKFIPVLLTGPSPEHIPKPLRHYTYHELSAAGGYEGLYRHLTGQPRVVKPVLGNSRVLPAEETRSFPPHRAESVDPQPRFQDEEVRRLSNAIKEKYELREALLTAEEDTTQLDEEILQLRRQIREGGQLKAGDFLLEGRFKLIELIGQGGFATVWKAYDGRRRELVAIKVLHGQHVEDRSRKERFFRGARKMAQIHHQNVVRVINEECQEGGYSFFVMEYMTGGDLRRAVRERRMSMRQIVQTVLEVGAALAFAHRQKVIHRDVKPANILLDEEARPKLTDFDLVYAPDTTGGTRTTLGTPVYAAPELMQRTREPNAQADVYGLGMTAIFALGGSDLPYAVIRDAQPFIESLGVPNAARVVLARAVAWELTERWENVEDFCGALRASFGDLVDWDIGWLLENGVRSFIDQLSSGADNTSRDDLLSRLSRRLAEVARQPEGLGVSPYLPAALTDLLKARLEYSASRSVDESLLELLFFGLIHIDHVADRVARGNIPTDEVPDYPRDLPVLRAAFASYLAHLMDEGRFDKLAALDGRWDDLLFDELFREPPVEKMTDPRYRACLNLAWRRWCEEGQTFEARIKRLLVWAPREWHQELMRGIVPQDLQGVADDFLTSWRPGG